MLTPAEAVAAAEGVLSRSLGRPVRLALVETLSDYPGSRNAVLRCRLAPAPSGMPDSVIVKYCKSGGEQLLQEWINLEFLGGIPAARALVPRLYGGEWDSGLLVVEDLVWISQFGVGR